MSECHHELHEMDAACADGMCPMCLADQCESLRSRLAEAEATLRAIQAVQWPVISPLPLADLRALPDPLAAESVDVTESGVYFLWRTDQLVYVGQSRNIGPRLCQHVTNRDSSRDLTTSKAWGRPIEFDAQTWLAVPWPYHLAVEAVYIERFQPIENRKR